MFSRHLVQTLCLIASFLFTTIPLRAENDEVAIRNTIQNQLQAFAEDDGEKAYSYAAPIVRFAFPKPEMFMSMVMRGYRPVYRNTARKFGELFQDQLGRPSMRVFLTGDDDKRYEAIYVMERQQDGTWKIAGCVIVNIPMEDV